MRDVQDTIEWIKPSLMKVFAAGDEVAKFDPFGEEDEEQAEQEADYVRYRSRQAQGPGNSRDYAFWLYLLGMLTFWGALSARESDSELAKAMYALLNVGFVFLGAPRPHGPFDLWLAL